LASSDLRDTAILNELEGKPRLFLYQTTPEQKELSTNLAG